MMEEASEQSHRIGELEAENKRLRAALARAERAEKALEDLIDVFDVCGSTVSIKPGRILQIALMHARDAIRNPAEET